MLVVPIFHALGLGTTKEQVNQFGGIKWSSASGMAACHSSVAKNLVWANPSTPESILLN